MDEQMFNRIEAQIEELRAANPKMFYSLSEPEYAELIQRLYQREMTRKAYQMIDDITE